MRKSQLTFGASLACLMLATAHQANAQQLAAATSDAIETITIMTSGSARQVQSIDNEALIEAAPGTSPIKEIALLPGVNYTGSDSFGAYEWATRISVRGFAQYQLGFTLDGVPLGDMSYGNWNGLHISRAIIDENIAKTSISQGAGSLSTASNSNLGGTLQFTSLAPADKAGVSFAQSFGSDSTYRTFAKLDSGLLDTGTKFDVSMVYNTTDTWKGDFPQHYVQANGKVEQKLGDDNVLTAFFNYSDRRENDYQDLSKNYIQHLGYGWTNYSNWTDAVNSGKAYAQYVATGGTAFDPSLYRHGELTTNDPFDAAYGGSAGLRIDYLAGATLDTTLAPNASVKTTIYGHTDRGDGIWVTPYVGSPNGTPLSERTTEYKQMRTGVTSDLTWDIGNNTIAGGFWYGFERFNNARRYYQLSASEAPDTLAFPSNPFRTDWETDYDTNIYQGYVQDTYRFADGSSVYAGFKGSETEITAHQVTGAYANGTLTSANGFLPQIGGTYSITPSDELFADVAENMRSFGAAPDSNAFQTTQSAFDSSNLKPETSWTEEVGFRTKHGPISATLDGYHVNFSNWLLAVAQCPGIVGCPAAIANVGGVTSNGAELSVDWKLLPNLSWYNGMAYNRSTYNNDVFTSGVTQHLSGKTLVDTPDYTWKTQVNYHLGDFYGTFTGNYMSRRYFTYTNDQSVPDFMTFDLTVGFNAESVGPLHDVRVQFNIDNLFDKQYVGTIGTNGFGFSGDNQTLQAGAPRAFFGTVSAKF